MMTITTAAELDVQELVSFLAEEIELYQELVVLGQREKSAILGREPGELNAIVVEKERIVARIGRIDARRQSWVKGWAGRHSPALANPSLLNLLATMSEDEARDIGHMREGLLRVMRDLAELNHANGMLVQSALQLVTRSIDAFSRISGSNEHYEQTGARARNSRTTIMDWSA